MKHGPTAVFGWDPALAIVADRARLVHLYETDFIRKPIIPGVSIKRRPTLPNNVFWMNDPSMPAYGSPYGAAVVLKSIESDTIRFVPGARIMGPLQHVKDHLRGRKFFIRNRFSDNVCVELA